MKTLLLFVAFLACLSSAYGDMLGINIELIQTNQGKALQTLVSIQAGYLTNYDRVNVPVKAAAEDLRNLRFPFDGKFAVIRSAYPVPVEDLMPILEAMSSNQIGLYYIKIGSGPPSGMDAPRHNDASVPTPTPATSTHPPRSVESFRFIGTGTTIQEVIAKLGHADFSQAGGFYDSYNYYLSDGSSVNIGADDGGKILFVMHTETLFGHTTFDKR